MRRPRALLLRLGATTVLAVVGITLVFVLRDGDSAPVASPAAAAATPRTTPAVAAKPEPKRCRRMGAARARARPADFPAGFPLPRGTVLTEVKRQSYPGEPTIIYVRGFVPLSLRSAILYYVRELPRHHYSLRGGDAEAWEADTRFAGNGHSGGLRLAMLGGCTRTVALLVGIVGSSANKAAARG